VQRVEDFKWSDLGEPKRVLDVLSSSRHRPAWVDSFEHERAIERRQ
jgi:hypothetical protein